MSTVLKEYSSKSVRLLMAIILTLGICIPAITIQPTEAFAATTTLKTDGSVYYGSTYTSIFRVGPQNVLAYCAQPQLSTPSSGTYTKDYSLSGISGGVKQQIAALLWYAPEGPSEKLKANDEEEAQAYNAYWNFSGPTGKALTKNDKIVAIHLAIASRYAYADDVNVFSGIAYTSYADWVAKHVAFAVPPGRTESWVLSNRDDHSHLIGHYYADKWLINRIPSDFINSIYVLHTGSGSQDIFGYDYEPKGWIQIDKQSANTSITNGNDCYDLNGAEFAVYASEADAKADKNRINTFWGDVKNLVTAYDKEKDKYLTGYAEVKPGTYWVKETKAPKGYAPDTKVYQCTVSANKTTTVTFKDEPQNDPILVGVRKIDAETGKAIPLTDAEFTFNYYDGYYDDFDKLPAKPTAQWVIATTDGGFANYRNADQRIVSQTQERFKNADGRYVMPLGTVTIHETKAPTGYVLDDNHWIMAQILPNSNGTGANWKWVNYAGSVFNLIPLEEAGFEVGYMKEMPVPSLNTTLTAGGKHEVIINKSQTFVDKVDYRGLTKGKTYTFYGMLKSFTSDGKEIETIAVSEPTTLTLEDTHGTLDVTFKGIDTLELAGKKVVCYEYAYEGTPEATAGSLPQGVTPVAKHENPNDEGQTVNIKPDTPHLEKYINKDVHQDLKDVEEVFTYDVLAYVTRSAVSTTITDQLVKNLAFANGADTKVTVADVGTSNNHKTNGSFTSKNSDATVTAEGKLIEKANITINDKLLTVKLEDATPYRGHWVRVTFDAKVAEEGGHKTITENAPVLSDKEHTGIPNQASYTVDLANKPGAYNLESNIVTVKPPAPEIGTTLTAGGKHEVMINESTEFVDKVDYKNLIPGNTYTFYGKLVAFEPDGTEIGLVAISEPNTITPSASSGTTQVVFKNINTLMYKDKKLVCYEYAYKGTPEPGEGGLPTGGLIAKHEDSKDEGQTVNIKPDKARLEKYINKDVHQYTLVGDTFTYDVMAYVPRDADNFTVTDSLIGEIDFIKGADTKVDVADVGTTNNHKTNGTYTTFNEDATVSAEGVAIDGAQITIDGKNLTVKVADAKPYRGHWVRVTFGAVLTADGEYTTIENNGSVLSEKSHKGLPNQAEYSVGVGNNPNAYGLKSNIVTVIPETPKIEKYINKDVHQDLESANDIFTYDVMAYVTRTAISTTITDELVKNLEFAQGSDTKVAVADMGTKNNHLTNGVYTAENADATVTAEGVAIDGAQISIDGNLLTVKIADATPYQGHWVRVTFDAKVAEDADYELVTKNAPVVSDKEHEGIPNKASYSVDTATKPNAFNKESNTVTVVPPAPEIGTVATGESGEHFVQAGKETKIVDRIAYTNLLFGKQYTAYGQFVDKITGEPVGDPVAWPFIASEEGYVDIEFTLDTSGLIGSSIVCFEEVYFGLWPVGPKPDGDKPAPTPVAEHKDKDDESQAVRVIDIRTKATGTNGSIVTASKNATVTDTVSYTGLTPNAEYTLYLTVMDAATEQPLLVNGKPVTATGSFTPKEANGTQDVVVTFDASSLGGSKLVMFEELYFGTFKNAPEEGKKPIAVHKDINDLDQTVTVPAPPESPKTPPSGKYYDKTGNVLFDYWYVFAGLALVLIGGVAYALYARRRAQKSSDNS